MIKIYHNNRCRMSRNGLKILEDSGKDFEIVHYLKEPLTHTELENIIALLNIKPINLVRKNEAVWKENFKQATLTDTEIIEAMVAHPKLIERPIVINGHKAAIGRPPELIFDIL
ncbi:arsenate reductase (glutaredoxin) [Bizionia sediminis]|uniref:Arsenate reductase (Glutaredoxin) n=1 Tax=Bizionia sediminis TaxID=1737064 RepID=A0ABW5KQ81_9FLAO